MKVIVMLMLIPRSNFAEIFGIRKLESLGVPCGVVCVILRLAVLVELRLVTDGQTDRHRHRPMASVRVHVYSSLCPRNLQSRNPLPIPFAHR